MVSASSSPSPTALTDLALSQDSSSSLEDTSTVGKTHKQQGRLSRERQHKVSPLVKRPHSKSDPVRFATASLSHSLPKEIQAHDFKSVTPNPSPEQPRKEPHKSTASLKRPGRRSNELPSPDPEDKGNLTAERRTVSLSHLLHRKQNKPLEHSTEMDPYKNYRLVLNETTDSESPVSRLSLAKMMDDLTLRTDRNSDQSESFCYRTLKIKGGKSSFERKIDPKTSIYEPSQLQQNRHQLFLKIRDLVDSSGCLKTCERCGPAHRIKVTLKSEHTDTDKQSDHESELYLKAPDEPDPKKLGDLFFDIFKKVYSLGYTASLPSDEAIRSQVSLLFNSISLQRESGEMESSHQHKFLTPLIPAYPLLYAMTPSSIFCARRVIKKALPVLAVERENVQELYRQTLADGKMRSYVKWSKKSLDKDDEDRVTINISGEKEAKVIHRHHHAIHAIIVGRRTHFDPEEELHNNKHINFSSSYKIGELFIDYIVRPIVEDRQDRHKERHYDEKHPHPLFSVEILPSKLICRDENDPDLQKMSDEVREAVTHAVKTLKEGFGHHLVPKKYEFEGNTVLCEKK